MARAITLTDRAATARALTPRGQRLRQQLRRLDRDNRALGYGKLSTLGVHELQAIGERSARQFQALTESGDALHIVTSGVERTRQSADAFVAGAQKVEPELRVVDEGADAQLLQFDKTDTAYAQFIANDSQIHTALDRLRSRPEVLAAARRVLEKSYTAAFVSTIGDPVTAAEDIYILDAITAGLVNDTQTDLSDLIPQDDRAVFERLSDARYFYESGPGIEHRNAAATAAGPLLYDFFRRVDETDETSTAAVFRFAHAEEIAPFATLLRLPGSRRAVTLEQAEAGKVVPWSAAQVSPMAANITWLVYRDKAGTTLVTVLHNERQSRLGNQCRPITSESFFYSLQELRSCLISKGGS